MRKNDEIRKDLVKVVAWLIAFVALAALGQLCTSCSPRFVTIETEKHVTDTLIRERIVHDSVKVMIPYEVEKIVTRDDSSHLENSFAVSDARVVDGMLFHSLESKPQEYKTEVLVPVRDTVIVTKDSETIVKEVPRKLTWWQRVRLDGFNILAVILALYVCIRIVGKKLKIFNYE